MLEHLSVELADSLMPYACLDASQLVVGKWPMVMVSCFFILFSCTMFLLSEIIMLAGHVLPAFVGIPSGNQTLLAGKSHYIIHIKIYIYIYTL